VPPDSFATVLGGYERILIETPTDLADPYTSSNYRVIDRATGDTLLEFAAPMFYETISISPNARFFAVIMRDATIEVWDVETGHSVTLVSDDSASESMNDEPNIGRVQWSPDEEQLLVKYIGEHTIRLWDVVSGTVIQEYEALYGEGNDFLWWQDGSLVAIQYIESVLRLWKVDSGEDILVVTLTESISSARVSPNFDLIAVGTKLGNIMLIDLVTGEILNTMQAHVGDAFVGWSYDGTLIRSRGDDYTTHLWGIPSE
jgi:WD40 repeat protein